MESLHSNPSSFQYTNEDSTLRNKKLPMPQSMHSLRSQRSIANIREVSVSIAMSRLRIGGEVIPTKPHEHQAISPVMRLPTPTCLSQKPLISTGMRNLRRESTGNALVLYQSPGDGLVAPKARSPIRKFPKANIFNASPATPCRIPRPFPQNTPYLTKDSNLSAFIAWDVHGRLEDMEAMYSELKETLTGTSLERNGLEEAVAVYKARSQSSVLINSATFADTSNLDSC